MKHRFPRSRHDGRHESGRTLRGVAVRRDLHRIPLIAIEEHVVGTVRMNVDHTGRDRGACR